MRLEATEELRSILRKWTEQDGSLDVDAIIGMVRKISAELKHLGKEEPEFGVGSTSPATVTEALVILPRRPEFGVDGHRLDLRYTRGPFILARRPAFAWSLSRKTGRRVPMTLFVLRHDGTQKTIQVLREIQPGAKHRTVEEELKLEVDELARKERTGQ